MRARALPSTTAVLILGRIFMPHCMRMRCRIASLVACCFALVAPHAHAQFSLANQRITVVVGLPPGGAYDSYSRLIGRHVGRFLPGNPGAIVQNMPGAGS